MGLILPLLSMSIAVAQDDGQVAKQFYLNGKMLFEEERYEEAIIAWEKAYEASEKPVILYNIAIAHEKLESYQQAIDTLYRYRIYASQEEQEDLVVKIAELKVKLESAQNSAIESMADDYQVDKVKVPITQTETQQTNMNVPEGITDDVKAARVSLTSDSVSVVHVNKAPMYIAWGVGTASFSTGMVFGLLANQSNNMAEYVGGCGTTNKGVLLCTSNSEGETYYWEARRRAIVADVGYGLSVLSVGTAVWLTYKSMNDSSRSIASSVWIAPDGVGLQGRF